MMHRFQGNVAGFTFLLCSFIVIKDVFGDDWDPLPAGVRSVVSSNLLGESPPQVFAEYHALLPTYRGDYGVKSELIDAASEEPVYKGAETLLVPLYIPQGAVPLIVNERRVRSGKADGIANMKIFRGPVPAVRDASAAASVNRPTRRVLSSIRRPSAGARPLPTPPAAYLRPWIKRRSGGTPSPVEEDNVEEAKRNKQKLLTQMANFKRRMEDSAKHGNATTISPLQTSTAKDFLKINESSKLQKENKEAQRIKKITTRIENRFSSKSFTETTPQISSTPAPVVNVTDVEIFVKNVTSSSQSDITVKLNGSNESNNFNESSSSSVSPAKIESITPKPLSHDRNQNNRNVSSTVKIKGNRPTVIPVIRRRPLLSKSAEDTRSRMKPVVPTRSILNKKLAPVDLNPTKTNSSETSTAQPLTSSTVRATYSPSRNRNTTQSIKSVLKSQDWLKRKRESIMKDVQSSRLSSYASEQKSSSESIIDRVLSSAASQNVNEDSVSKADEVISNSSIQQENNNGSLSAISLPKVERNNNNVTLSRLKEVRSKESFPLLNPGFTSEGASGSYRHKIPVRVRRPIVSNPLQSSTSTTVSPSITTPAPSTTTSTSTTVKAKEFNYPKRTPATLNAKPSVKDPVLQTGKLISSSTPRISTSTPRLLYEIATSPPSTQNPKRRNFANHTLRDFRIPFGSAKNRPSPPSSITSVPRMKSPQDIVLEKLSELMKNATKGSKNNLEIIVQEIEKLNKELASMGIHIIDAEFDGHKIKLKDQENRNRSGINLSGATTIRYVIPNTNGRSKPRNPEPQIINHGKEGAPFPIRDPFAGIVENPVHTKWSNTRSPGTQYRYGSTEKPETTYFTLRHQNETFGRKPSTPSPAPPASSSQSTSKESELTSESSNEAKQLPVIIKTIIDKDKEELVTKITATTTRSSNEATRTRSTSISISTPKSEDSRIYTSTAPTKIVNNLENNLNGTNESTLAEENLAVNPTAHLRPTLPKEVAESTEPELFTTTTTTLNVVSTSDKSNTQGSVKSPKEGEESQPNAVDAKTQFPILVSEYDTVLSTDISSDDSNADETDSYIYFIGILGVVPCVAAIVILYRQRHKREKKSLPEREERADTGLTPPTNHSRNGVGHNDTLDAFPGYIFESSMQRDSPWELSRSKLRLTSVIGEGNFGIVWKAEARNLCDWDGDAGPTVLVAVKGVKEGAGTKEKNDLLRELSIMQHLGQQSNIVTLLGCCTTHEPYFLVMEYVMFGKLLTFLREQRSKNNYFNFSSDSDHLTSRDLTKFASQIATGCEYLQTRGVIHRDLAARNILVDHNKICKIADFGLARSVKDMDNDIYEQKSKGPLPIRWMAPESLYMNIFTHKSDVWSFGILCWEIVTLGSTPYPGISAREVMRRVREGYRLERPEHCRSEFYKILTKCWHQDMNRRASFTTVKEELRKLLEIHTGWIDLENFQESTYYSMHQNNEEKL